MLRNLRAFLVLGVWIVVYPAAAQEPSDEPASEEGTEAAAADETATEDRQSAEADSEQASPKQPAASAAAEGQASVGVGTELAATGAATAPEPAAEDEQQSAEASDEPVGAASDTRLRLGGRHTEWETGVTGYFRAPMAIGLSKRPGPDDFDGPARWQLSYGPTRTMDANYYSFAYTRLQEQDWMEVAIYARKKHVEAAVGWMGYWYQAAGFRNPDAGWMPGIARLTLDTDFGVQEGSIQPNLAVTGGAWWPRFGYHVKYDTYTLGLFRQLGGQVHFALSTPSGFATGHYFGFGTARDGSYNYQIGGAPPIYGAEAGLGLIAYTHQKVSYKDYVELGVHLNRQWTRDPRLTQLAAEGSGKTYSDARDAHLTTVGGEVTLSAPYAGRLWVSPSVVTVRNGWALSDGGTEVMHSLGGAGVSTNYMAWTNTPSSSKGSGRLFNLGFLYENTLSSVMGQKRGSMIPDVSVSGFGLLADATLDLPSGSGIPQDHITQLKWGADAEVQIQDWVAFMLRYDEVNYDMDHPGYIFSAITPRLTFSSHFLSGESIYLQYSRYRYGDRMVLAGQWPWGQPLVAGSDIIQRGPYNGWKPDMDVIKLQASIAF